MSFWNRSRFVCGNLIAGAVAAAAGLVVVFGWEVLWVEPRPVINFVLTFLSVFGPVVVLVEFGRRKPISGRIGRWLEYQQGAFVALVVHKYIWGAAMIPSFSLRGLDLYGWVLAGYGALNLILAWRGPRAPETSTGKMAGLQRWGVGGVTVLTAVVFVALVVHRARPFIPSLTTPPLSVADAFVDRSAEFGFEVLSPDLQVDGPMCLFPSPDPGDEFCLLTRDGRVLSVFRGGGGWGTREILNISDRFASLDTELGAAAAVFGREEVDDAGRRHRRLFLFYVNGGGDQVFTHVVSFGYDSGPLRLRPDSERQLIKQRTTSGEHNGGGMLFGPDGYLYVSFGDGSAGYDMDATSQTLTKGLAAGIIRIDPYGDDPANVKPIERQPEGGETAHYWIPRDNPFVDRGDVLAEYWALGLRNPFRMAFLPDGKRLVVADVGQASYEEINLMGPGDNAEWSFAEGPLRFRHSAHRGRAPAGYDGDGGPYYWYRNVAERGAVIGGFVVEGGNHPTLDGRYVFTDHRSGELYALDLGVEGKRPVPEILVSSRSPGVGIAYWATSLYPYRGSVLVTRLGTGEGGKTILRLRRAGNLSADALTPIERTPRETFTMLCASCHGSLDGTTLAGLEGTRNFRDRAWQESVTDETLRQSIANGLSGGGGDIAMPAWRGVLTDEEIDALIEVVRGLGNSHNN